MTARLLTSSSALLWGLQFAFLSPVLALLLTGLYGATPAEVGWVLAVYNAGGFVVSLAIPAWADRRRNYLAPLLIAGVLTIALAAALALATTLPLAAIALIVLGGPAAVGTTLLFAQLRHSGAGVAEVMNTRAIVSFSWVAGPPVATLVMGMFGDRAILPMLGVVGVLNVVTTLFMIRRGRTDASAPRTAQQDAEQHRSIRLPAVTLVVVAFVLLQATNSAVMSIMTLYVTAGLDLPVLWGGITLGVAALLEVPALWLIGRYSSRFSMKSLIIAGCVAGLAYYLVMMVLRDPVSLLAAQVLNALSFAVVSGIGMTLFQEIIPRPGLATGLFMNTRRMGAIISGGIIAVAGIPEYGFFGMFAVCAILTGVATVILGVVRSSARPSSS